MDDIKKFKISKKILLKILRVLFSAVFLSAFLLLVIPSFLRSVGIMPRNVAKTVASARLEKAIDINELSSTEFVYNGIAQAYRDSEKTKVKYNICYDATVKVGIQMTEIKFEIDEKNKLIKPILPSMSINNVILDPSSISYIPENATVDLKEAFSICKADVENEAQKNGELLEAAKENIKSTIEALLYPVLDAEGYKISWES